MSKLIDGNSTQQVQTSAGGSEVKELQEVEKVKEEVRQEVKTMSLLEAIEFGNMYVADYYHNKNKDNLIFIETFHRWNGDLWQTTNDNSMMHEIISSLADELKQETRLPEETKKKKMKHITTASAITLIKNLVKAKVVKHTEEHQLFAVLDSSRNTVNYKNGILNLENGSFRKRVKTDYVSKCLSYDYIEDKSKFEKEINHINELFKRVCNNSDEMYEFKKLCLAYFLTGETKENKFIIESGLGGNGKSFMIEAFETVFDIYVKKLGNKTFCSNYQKSHKQLIDTLGKRLTYIEEVCVDKLDTESIKDYVNGSKITVEKLFSTTVEFDSHAKLVLVGNKPPEFASDNGIKRRGIVCEYKNQFVDDPEHVDEKKGIYLANKDLKLLFKTESYKNALIHILLPYTILYYKDGFKVPKEYKTLFNDLCDENDVVKAFIDDNFVKTNNDNDRVAKDDFTKFYNQHTKSNCKFINILNDVKRLGLTYKKDLRVNGKRGVICGLRYRNEDEDDDDTGNTNGDQPPMNEPKVESDSESESESESDSENEPEDIPIVKRVKFLPDNRRKQHREPEKKPNGLHYFKLSKKVEKKVIKKPEPEMTYLKDALKSIQMKKKSSSN